MNWYTNDNYKILSDHKALKLTPSQCNALNQAKCLFQKFNILIMDGESGVGKYTTAMKLMSEFTNDLIVIDFSRIYDEKISNNNLEILNIIYNDITDALCEKLTVLKEGIGNFKYILIKNIDTFYNTFTDYSLYYKKLVILHLNLFIKRIKYHRVIICGGVNNRMLINIPNWKIILGTKYDDYIFILKCQKNLNIDDKTIKEVAKNVSSDCSFNTIVKIGRYISSMKNSSEYGLDMEEKFKEDVKSNPECHMVRKALENIHPNGINVEENIYKPVQDIDLLGLDHVLKILETNVIKPITNGLDIVNICSGILIHGPSGSGKTTIGKWLAHKIQGKIFIVSGSVGSSGNNLFESFTIQLAAASACPPAVVYIDDVDSIFDDDNNQRLFLTMLDSIETKYKENVCLICTCMDIKKVPRAMLRGGRIEKSIKVDLPNEETVKLIVKGMINNILKSTEKTGSSEHSTAIESLKQFCKYILQIKKNKIYSQLSNMSGADIKRIINATFRDVIYDESCIISTEEAAEKLVLEHIKNVKDQLTQARYEPLYNDKNPDMYQ